MLWYKWMLLAFVSQASSQNLTPEQEEQLRSFIAATMECRKNVGMAIALVRNDETIFSEGFGFRDLDQGLPMTADTRISIASISKAFTTTLLADSVAKGLVSWDAPLQEVLGDEFGLEGEFRTEEVSVRDVVAHRTGMPSYWGFTTAAANFTREQLVME